MSKLKLGDRVTFTQVYEKKGRYEDPKDGDIWSSKSKFFKEYVPVGLPTKSKYTKDAEGRWYEDNITYSEGFIVGKRSLSDYQVVSSDNGPEAHYVGTRKVFYQVAYDLHRKIALVHEDDLELCGKVQS